MEMGMVTTYTIMFINLSTTSDTIARLMSVYVLTTGNGNTGNENGLGNGRLNIGNNNGNQNGKRDILMTQNTT